MCYKSQYTAIVCALNSYLFKKLKKKVFDTDPYIYPSHDAIWCHFPTA